MVRGRVEPSSASKRQPAAKPSGLGWVLAVVGIVAVCASVAFGVKGYLKQQQKKRVEANQVVERLQNEYRDITSAADGPDGLPQKIEKKVDVASTAKGELGEMEKFLRQLMADMVAQRNEYFTELDALGWNQVLDGKRVQRDSDMGESRRVIAAARGLVDKYEAKSRGLLDGIPAAVQALKLSDASKRDMIQGFERSSVAARAQLVELWGLERQALGEIDGALNVLHGSRGRWKFDGGNFVFADQRTLDAFNRHMASVQTITQKQTDIQKRNASNTLSKMEKMKQ